MGGFLVEGPCRAGGWVCLPAFTNATIVGLTTNLSFVSHAINTNHCPVLLLPTCIPLLLLLLLLLHLLCCCCCCFLLPIGRIHHQAAAQLTKHELPRSLTRSQPRCSYHSYVPDWSRCRPILSQANHCMPELRLSSSRPDSSTGTLGRPHTSHHDIPSDCPARSPSCEPPRQPIIAPPTNTTTSPSCSDTPRPIPAFHLVRR